MDTAALWLIRQRTEKIGGVSCAPSRFAAYNARAWVNPALVKVGPEGYIHGWICVRPPCGEKDKLKLKPRGEYTSFASRPVYEPGQLRERFTGQEYEVLHAGTGEHVGTVREVPDPGGSGAHVFAGRHMYMDEFGHGDDPTSPLKEMGLRENLKLVEKLANDQGMGNVGREVSTAFGRIVGNGGPMRREDLEKYDEPQLRNALEGYLNTTGEEWIPWSVSKNEIAAYDLRKALKIVDATPPNLDPRVNYNNKQLDQLRNAINDLHFALTGTDVPDRREWKVPDEPWAKAGGNIRQKDLEVRWRGGEHIHPLDWSRGVRGDGSVIVGARPGPQVADVVHVPTGTVIGTVSKEYLDPKWPWRSQEQLTMGGKIYYTARHADGSVVSFATSSGSASGESKSLTALMYAQNMRARPRPVEEPKPEPTRPTEGPKPDFNANVVINDVGTDVPEIGDRVRRQLTKALNAQSRYLPTSILGKMKVKVAGGGLQRRSWLGQHTYGSHQITIRADMTDAMGDPGKNDRDLQRYQASHWWTPVDDKYDMVDSVLGHEVGHGVGDMVAKQGRKNPELWRVLANGIGVPAPQGADSWDDWGTNANMNRWMGAFKGKIQREVSEYGASDFHEMLAELWNEYTMNSSPRPAAKAYGDYVMQLLAQEEQ